MSMPDPKVPFSPDDFCLPLSKELDVPTSDYSQRYARQLALPEIGPEGQRRLAQSHIALVGVGGLGSVAGFYLAAAGVGRMTLIDGDMVEFSNLQRQIAHTTGVVGQPKALSAQDRFRALNPHVEYHTAQVRLERHNACELLGDCHLVVDATDNLSARFNIAEACHRLAKPWVHGGIDRFIGQVMTILPDQTACYRCVFRELPEGPPSPPRGPLGVLPAVIGALQATEALKYLLGIGQLLTDRILVYDALAMRFRQAPVRRSADCPLCGGR